MLPGCSVGGQVKVYGRSAGRPRLEAQRQPQHDFVQHKTAFVRSAHALLAAGAVEDIDKPES